MKELAKLEEERGNPAYLSKSRNEKKERVASNEMCTFLILNISSLQLIPVNKKDNMHTIVLSVASTWLTDIVICIY